MKKIVLAFFAASAVLISACGNSKGGITPGDVNNPATASGDYDPEDQPKMEFESTDYNFGTIQEGEIVKHTFKFKNTGKNPLIISEARTTCGCTVSEYPEDPVQPGDEGEIKVRFDSKGKAMGDVEAIKSVTVIANTTPNKVILKIHGYVKK